MTIYEFIIDMAQWLALITLCVAVIKLQRRG